MANMLYFFSKNLVMHRVVRIILLFLGLQSCLVAFSQDLVIDGGFEDVSILVDSSKDEVIRYNKWISLTPVPHWTRSGAPYFPNYLKRRKGASDVIDEDYVPFAGQCYMACFNFTLRNLHQGRLRKKVKKGRTYKVSFKVKVISDYYGRDKVEQSINGKIGVMFTTKSLNSPKILPTLRNHHIELKPSVVLDEYSFDCEEQWITFSELWKADKDYSHIIVGNFVDIIKSYEIGLGYLKGVLYELDNLSVVEVSSFDETRIGKDSVSNCTELTSKQQDFRLSSRVEFDSTLYHYYNLVQEAESSIIDKQYTAAGSLYWKAFQLKKPFSIDYFNFYFLLKLDTINNKNYLVKLRDRKLRYGSNANLRNQIDSILYLDQKCRMDGSGIERQDMANALFLIDLYRRGVDLSEDVIGHSGMERLIVVLLHLSRYEQFGQIKDYLYSLTRKGKFYNRDFANLIDSYVKNNTQQISFYYTESAFPIFTKFVIPQLDSALLAQIDRDRKSVYLENLEEQYQKQFFNFNNGYENFNFGTFFTILPGEEFASPAERKEYLLQEEEMIQDMKKKYEHITIKEKKRD